MKTAKLQTIIIMSTLMCSSPLAIAEDKPKDSAEQGMVNTQQNQPAPAKPENNPAAPNPSQDEADIIKQKDRCNEFLEFPVGGTILDFIGLFGQPKQKRDISIQSYTWRIGDNFMTLQYDEGSLVSIEVDKNCQGDVPDKICVYFREFRQTWPDFPEVKSKIGNFIEEQAVPRAEWIWISDTEKVYVEIVNESIENMECVPKTIRYEYVESKDGQDQSEQDDDYIPPPPPQEEESQGDSWEDEWSY